MSASLIINADDFGLTPGINRAIGELHAAGALTSATLMATGPAFADAVGVARANPGLGVGCHIVLTDGIPVSHPEEIPSLMGADGKTFRPSLIDFVQAVLRGHISEEEVAREALAQVQKLQREGIDVTHLDTHKHTHLFPSIARPLLRVAERASVGAMRNPFEQSWSINLPLSFGLRGRLRRFQVKLLSPLQAQFESHREIRNAEVLTTDGTIGVALTGRLDGPALARILSDLPADGTYELCCHPGYNDADLDRIPTRLRAQRDVERLALLAELPRFFFETVGAGEPPALIHYGQLGSFGALRDLGQFTPNTGYEEVL